MAGQRRLTVELPHLTMYLRQLKRRFPWWIALFPVGYALVGVVVIVLGSLPQTYGQLSSSYLRPNFMLDTSFMVAMGTMLVGTLITYWIIAAQMGRLVRNVKLGDDQWHTTPVSNRAALAGVLAITAITAAVPLLSLYAFMLLVPAGLVMDERFYASVALSFLRLGHFALFCGCLHLVLQGTRIGWLIPWLAAPAAVMSVFWDLGMLVLQYGPGLEHGLYIPGPYDAPLPFAIEFSGLIVVLGLIGLALLQYLLRFLCRDKLPGYLRFLVILPVLLIPVYVGYVGFIDINGGHLHLLDLGGWLQLPVHACLSNIYPDIYICSEYERFSFGSVWVDGSYLVYGYLTGLAQYIGVAVTLYFLSLLMWVRTTLKCLDSVRSPGHTAAPRSAR